MAQKAQESWERSKSEQKKVFKPELNVGVGIQNMDLEEFN